MALDAQGEARGSGRRVAAWILTAVSPVIAYVVVKAAAAGISAAAAMALAPLPPVDPSSTLKFLARLAQQPKVPVSEQTRQSARQSLIALPLAFEPFYVAAREAEQKGDLRRAITLMEEARRRRPSYPAIRMQLMIYYIQAQRYREGLAEVDVVLRRSGELRPKLLPELSKLIEDPRGREALAGILATQPSWREEFFAAAGSRKIDPADARDLHDRIRARNPRGDLRLERQLILQAHASSGDYAGARTTWLAGLPPARRAAAQRLFDGNFTGATAPRPFGWKYEDLDAGRAEPTRDGGRSYLDVAYFGGRAVTLAEQVLALPPGRYTIRAIARSPNGINSGKIFWRLSCLPARNSIGELDMTPSVAADRRFAAAFTVPASGCGGQQIELVAEPGDVAAVVNLEVSGLEVTP